MSNLTFLFKDSGDSCCETVKILTLIVHIYQILTSLNIGTFTLPKTALVKIHNDILSSTDERLSHSIDSARAFPLSFDTIDHTFPSEQTRWRLVSCEWEGTWLVYITYRTGRSQRINLGELPVFQIRSHFSESPKGQFYSTLLFTLYTTPLSSLISGHAIPHHLYAHDSQLHVSFSSGNSAAALSGLHSCLAPVQSWMSTNKLKLNRDKTEFLLIGDEWQ